jgi:UDP-glucose 4-epimerase
MQLLVTGGAGYIGSIVSRVLIDRGHDVVVFDNLERGHRQAVPDGARLIVGDLRNPADVDAALAGQAFDGVLHFAALSLVGESVEQPGLYWENNVLGTLNLLNAMVRHAVPRLVFSSTAATYGLPQAVPITEDAQTAPINPYGTSKLAVDMMIGDFCGAHPIGAVSLRYFNVAGAHGGQGEDHQPETHLIPNVLMVPLGKSPHVGIFGTDYPTPDGTAIRDYIHIDDLAEAHVLALEHAAPGTHAIYNLGTGTGFSVREIIAAVQSVTGQEVPVVESPRRAGDPPQLVASSVKAQNELGWRPQKSEIATMIADAWAFHRAHPDGYGD